MNFFTVLSLFLIVINVYNCKSVDFLIFPISLKSTSSALKPILTFKFHCDLTFPHSVVDNIKSFSFISLSPSQDTDPIKGYLCSKEKWTSKCEENLLTHQTQTFSITHQKISPSECLDAIKSYLVGGHDIPYKPNYQCSWLTTNYNSKTFILVTEHSVNFDHYSSSYLDSTLFSKPCSNFICETRFDSVLWAAREHKPPSCPNLIKKKITIYERENATTLDDVFISSDYIPTESWRSLCSGLNYCNQSFFLTRYGHGFVFPAEELNQILESFIDLLPNCNGREITVSTPASVRFYTHRDLEDSIRLERCMDTVEKIRSKARVTRRDLGFLQPLSEGIGDGLVIVNETVMREKVRYIGMNTYSLLCDLFKGICNLNYTSYRKVYGLEFRCHRIIYINKERMCDWYNGILLTTNHIIYPDEGIINREMLDIYLSELTVQYDTHLLLNASQKSLLSGEVDYTKLKNGNLIEYIEERWSSGLSWTLAAYLLGLISAALLIRTLFSVIQKRCIKSINPPHSIMVDQPVRYNYNTGVTLPSNSIKLSSF